MESCYKDFNQTAIELDETWCNSSKKVDNLLKF